MSNGCFFNDAALVASTIFLAVCCAYVYIKTLTSILYENTPFDVAYLQNVQSGRQSGKCVFAEKVGFHAG